MVEDAAPDSVEIWSMADYSTVIIVPFASPFLAETGGWSSADLGSLVNSFTWVSPCEVLACDMSRRVTDSRLFIVYWVALFDMAICRL